ncbi:MAG: putative LPS assembly protein LptD [Chitinophagales bacterium]
MQQDSSRFSSDSTLLNDSSTVFVSDTLNRNDTINMSGGDEIKDIIKYQADDSIVYDMGTKMMYLYNKGELTYQKINLKADLVSFDWTTFNLMAEGAPDSSGKISGKPIFKDDNNEYHAGRMKYNFKTKKGIVYEVSTKEGEAYIISETVKKNEYDEWFGKSSKYTTCDLESPHFYFKSKKVKIIPNKVMVTGPANLWIGDVPTPLFVPFGLFPVKQGRRSGLIMPEYGQDQQAGFFLRKGGYYWAVNDYMSLKFTGQVFTNGTFGVGVASQYALRYKFSGAISFDYLRSRPFDPDIPNAKSTNSYSFSWSHTQDPRSMPNSTFGAQVMVQSADFYQASRVTDVRLLNTSFNSSVSYSHTFPKSPFSLSINMRHDQNLLNRTIGFSIPTVRLSMSRVAPFKSKVLSGKPKWYENIGFTYAFEFRNDLRTYDSLLFRSETLDKFSMGVDQRFNLDAPITLFKYLNMNPSFAYEERTYFRGIDKRWVPDSVTFISSTGEIIRIPNDASGHIETDTSWRFNSARNFTAALSLSTKLIGIFKFKNSKLKAIKHVFTPSVSFNYNPDFGSNFWKYYRTVRSDGAGNTTRYQIFDPNPIYGVPAPGQVAGVFFSLANNFEMKTFSKKDTVNHEQKVGLLDQVNLSGGYNFAADSLRLQPFNLSIVSSRIFNLINLNFNAVFDPYATDSFNRKINTYEWNKNHRLLRFSTANISASMALHSTPRTKNLSSQTPPQFMGDYVSYNPNQIYDFDIPWNLGVSYRFNITRGTTLNPDTVITVQSISATADFNLTPHWKVAFSTGFDISRKQVTLTNISVIRDLHCWELSFTWTPALPTYKYQQFTILLHPKSNTLKDLKIQRKNNALQDL